MRSPPTANDVMAATIFYFNFCPQYRVGNKYIVIANDFIIFFVSVVPLDFAGIKRVTAEEKFVEKRV